MSETSPSGFEDAKKVSGWRTRYTFSGATRALETEERVRADMIHLEAALNEITAVDLHDTETVFTSGERADVNSTLDTLSQMIRNGLETATKTRGGSCAFIKLRPWCHGQSELVLAKALLATHAPSEFTPDKTQREALHRLHTIIRDTYALLQNVYKHTLISGHNALGWLEKDNKMLRQMRNHGRNEQRWRQHSATDEGADCSTSEQNRELTSDEMERLTSQIGLAVETLNGTAVDE